MNSRILFFIALFYLSISSLAQKITMTKDQRSLIDAENKFAATALAQNIKTAFKQVLDENSVVFRPQPVNGRYAYFIDARPDSTYLFWRPEFVEVSASGDFGYSTGPWYARRSKNNMEGRKGFGNFVTVWKKDKTGTWKVLLDKGVNYSVAGERKIELNVGVVNKNIPARTVDIAEIMAIDSKAFAGKEMDYYSNKTLLFEQSKWPYYSNADSLVAEYKNYESWEPLNGAVSSYGDMAFVYGKFNGFINGKKQDGYYLRVWKRNEKDEWKIALDLRTEN